LEKNFKSKNTTISSTQFDSCYLLSKGANGVHTKFIGAPIVMAPIRKLFGCPEA